VKPSTIVSIAVTVLDTWSYVLGELHGYLEKSGI
jgi:hypothetical protein